MFSAFNCAIRARLIGGVRHRSPVSAPLEYRYHQTAAPAVNPTKEKSHGLPRRHPHPRIDRRPASLYGLGADFFNARHRSCICQDGKERPNLWQPVDDAAGKNRVSPAHARRHNGPGASAHPRRPSPGNAGTIARTGRDFAGCATRPGSGSRTRQRTGARTRTGIGVWARHGAEGWCRTGDWTKGIRSSHGARRRPPQSRRWSRQWTEETGCYLWRLNRAHAQIRTTWDETLVAQLE